MDGMHYWEQVGSKYLSPRSYYKIQYIYLAGQILRYTCSSSKRVPNLAELTL